MDKIYILEKESFCDFGSSKKILQASLDKEYLEYIKAKCIKEYQESIGKYGGYIRRSDSYSIYSIDITGFENDFFNTKEYKKFAKKRIEQLQEELKDQTQQTNNSRKAEEEIKDSINYHVLKTLK